MSKEKLEDSEFFQKIERDRDHYSKILKRIAPDYEKLLHLAAAFMAGQKENTLIINELLDQLREDQLAINVFDTAIEKNGHDLSISLLELMAEARNMAAKALIKGVEIRKRSAAIRSANARHSKPGGSRDKALQIRDIWKSGKYSSRDICAEQECAELGMSFSTARKALRGTANPA